MSTGDHVPLPAADATRRPGDRTDPFSFTLDGRTVPYHPGDTILAAAHRAGHTVPHLCWAPELPPHGSCRVCLVTVDGRPAAACTTRAAPGATVACRTDDLDARRRLLLRMLLVEGQHFCPGCEKSGRCGLQSAAYAAGVVAWDFEPLTEAGVPDIDASHPDVWLDRGRCIRCGLCVRASESVDRKAVFALGGRGLATVLLVDSPSGQLADSVVAADDAAVAVCPVGALLPKRRGFDLPIGRRPADLDPLTGGDA